MKSTTAENKIAPPASAYQTGVVKVFTFLGFMTLIARAQWGGEGVQQKIKMRQMRQDTGVAANYSP